PGGAPDKTARRRRGRDLPDDARLCRRLARNDPAPVAPGEPRRPGRSGFDGGRRGDRARPSCLQARSGPHHGYRAGRSWRHLRPRLPRDGRAVARLLVVLRRASGDRAPGRGAMMIDHTAVYDLFAEYGALIDMAKFDEWLDLF